MKNDCRTTKLHFQMTFSLPSKSCLLKLPTVRSRRIPRHLLSPNQFQKCLNIARFWMARKPFFWPISEEEQAGDSDVFLHDVVFLKSSKLWSSQLWTQFKQLRIEAWESQDFNGVWTRDPAIPVRRSNQLSYWELVICVISILLVLWPCFKCILPLYRCVSFSPLVRRS